MTQANCPYTFTGNSSRVPRLTYDLPIAPTPSTLPHTTFTGTWISRTSINQIGLTTALSPFLTRSSLGGTTPQTSPTTYHSTAFLTFFLSNCFTVISQPCSTIMLTMSTISSKGGGGKASEEEKLNIPAFVKITNTSGFAIPASVLNRAWIALSQQIVNRNKTAAGNLDNNFLAFLWNHVVGIAPVSPVTVDTMTSYANTVYDANIGHNFTTCIIPEVFWQQTGYQAIRLEKKLGEPEGFIDLRIWVEVGYSCPKTRNLFTNNHRVMRIQVFLQATASCLQTPPFPISTLALHLAKLYGARTFFTIE